MLVCCNTYIYNPSRLLLLLMHLKGALQQVLSALLQQYETKLAIIKIYSTRQSDDFLVMNNLRFPPIIL